MAGERVEGERAWVVEAEYLAKKLFFHLASLLYLRGGTQFEGLAGINIHFFDFASSAVIARTAMETLLSISSSSPRHPMTNDIFASRSGASAAFLIANALLRHLRKAGNVSNRKRSRSDVFVTRFRLTLSTLNFPLVGRKMRAKGGGSLRTAG